MKNKSLNKWRNIRCNYMGITFDSIKERDRYIFLLDAQRRGSISNLRCQVPFELLKDEYTEEKVQLKTKVKFVNRRTFVGVTYKADFVYERNGKTIIEDVKSNLSKRGAIDRVFILKAKMMHSLLGIDIKKVDSPTAPV